MLGYCDVGVLYNMLYKCNYVITKTKVSSVYLLH